ncbi:MAG: hypothetical protein BWZ10_02763 [candidate division BRC1 bacterium ADurb.BinA364]|nr:MAG: hypothetical protein BWZ10_02763 [candidate division BRC1 bacterium ADurb.BinA364]
MLLGMPLPDHFVVRRHFIQIRTQQGSRADLGRDRFAMAKDHRVAVGQALEIVMHLAGVEPDFVSLPVEFVNAHGSVRRKLGVEQQMAIVQQIAEVAGPGRPFVDDLASQIDQQELERMVRREQHIARRGLRLVPQPQAVARLGQDLPPGRCAPAHHPVVQRAPAVGVDGCLMITFLIGVHG